MKEKKNISFKKIKIQFSSYDRLSPENIIFKEAKEFKVNYSMTSIHSRVP